MRAQAAMADLALAGYNPAAMKKRYKIPLWIKILPTAIVLIIAIVILLTGVVLDNPHLFSK